MCLFGQNFLTTKQAGVPCADHIDVVSILDLWILACRRKHTSHTLTPALLRVRRAVTSDCVICMPGDKVATGWIESNGGQSTYVGKTGPILVMSGKATTVNTTRNPEIKVS